jgi:hypothetical protein
MAWVGDGIDGLTRSEPRWDTADRRQQLAESLEDKGDREAVKARLLAEKHQGTHPSAAVAQKPSLANTSKMAKQNSKGRTLERGGLERWRCPTENERLPAAGCAFAVGARGAEPP